MAKSLDQIKKEFAAHFRQTPGYIGVKESPTHNGIQVYVYKEEDKSKFPDQFDQVPISFKVQETILSSIS